jgi:hypothetical protein
MPYEDESEHPPLTWGGSCPYCGQPIDDPLAQYEVK